VKPAPFAYTKARTLKEAITLLAKHKDNALRPLGAAPLTDMPFTPGKILQALG
jgi:hypothetical protein